MIAETTETRWFWATDNLPDLCKWFTGETLFITKNVESRTDEYLILPGCQSTGIKLRAGHLEVKILVADEGTFVFHDGVTGRVQRWIKWVFEDQAVRSFSGTDSKDWQSVTKSRLLRRFSMNGKLMERSSEYSSPASNCHIELTKVALPQTSKTWVTLGIESYGKNLDQTEVLKKTAQRFFLQQPQIPNELTHATSLSYPEWFALLE